VDESIDERVYRRFLEELALSGADGERLAAELSRLRDSNATVRDTDLVELYGRLAEGKE
jgi:hypothetical protein